MQLSREVPDHLVKEVGQTEQICMEFARGVVFLALDNSRDPTFPRNHLLACIADDFLETAVTLSIMAREGIHNACRRELRSLLEMSIKLAFVQQASVASSTEEKMTLFRRELDSPSISLRKRINLSLLPEPQREPFCEHVGRLYGESSNYVHLTTIQVQRKLEQIDSGRKSGVETLEEVVALNHEIHRNLAAAFVFVSHSVPSFAVGDLFLSPDGLSHIWQLGTDKYIAYLDEHFDYKHERQSILDKVKEERWSKVVDA